MDKLIDLFDVSNYKPPILRKPLSIAARSIVGTPVGTPMVVPAERLNELLNEAPLGKQYKVLRFLLRKDGTLVFAHEGTPGGKVPAHYQMTGQTHEEAEYIAAGNAYFDRKTNRCCIINHKSGDFRPPFESLWFALNAFSIAKVPMDDSIKLERLNSHGAVECEYVIGKKDILVNRISPIVEKLAACGAVGVKLTLQIRRLESGVYSYNPYWMNASKKLNAIICALPATLDEASLKALVRDPKSELYQALNMQRLPTIPILGRDNKARSLKALEEDDDDADHPGL
jgi:hypothetical protein